MRKTGTLILAFCIVLLSMLVPQAAAAGEYNVKYLSDDFIRIENVDTAFAAGTERSFTVNIPAAGNYAIFVAQTTPVQTAFQASFDQTAQITGNEALSFQIGSLETESPGYKYTYARIGAVGGTSGTVALYAGECTVTVISSVTTQIPYIDIKNTDVALNGGKLAIYPSDYAAYSNVTYYGHINGEMSANDNESIISGYDYWGDLSDAALDAPVNLDKKIHINGGQNVSYTLNVTKAGFYNISVYANYYSYGASTDATEDRNGSMTVSFDDEQIYFDEDTIFCKENGGTTDHLPNQWHNIDAVYMSEGTHTLKIASDGFGTYLKHLLLEEVVESDDKIVTVDDNLTRIEIDATANIVADGASKTVGFSIPVSGNYIFYINKTQNYAGEIDFSILDKVMENVFQYQGGLYSGRTYVKVGKADTAPAFLEQGVHYDLTIATTGADIEVFYVDVMRVDIPIDGATSIPSHYASIAGGIGDGHLNNTDQAKNEPTSGYTLIGDFRSNLLSNPKSTFPISLHLDNGTWVEYTFDVKTEGLYDIKILSNTYPTAGPDNESGENRVIDEQLTYMINGNVIQTVQYHNDTAADMTIEMPTVYLGTGLQTVRFSHPSEPRVAGFYFKEILVEPSEESLVLDATVLPVEFNSSFISDTTGTTTGSSIVLNEGEQVTFQFQTGTISASDLNMINSTVPQNASITYTIDAEEAQTVTVNQLGKIFQNKTFTEGTHTLIITSNTAGVSFDKLMLCEHEEEAITHGSKVEIPADSIRTPIDLDYGLVVGGKASVDPSTGIYTVNGLASYVLYLNVEESGYYTIYANALMHQDSFHVLFNDADVTTNMYQDTGNKDNVSASTSVRLKRLAVPTFLEAGDNTVCIQVKDGNFAEIHSLELQRTDGPVSTDVTEETIIPAWNHVSWGGSGFSTGWYFPHQDGQGGYLNVGVYEDLRNIVVESGAVYTFKVTVEESGYYDYGLYFSNATNLSTFNFVIDDVPYELSGTPSGTTKLTSTEAVYLTQGTHTVAISKKSSAGGTNRVFALSFSKSANNTITIDDAASKAMFEVNFGKETVGTVITALYKGNELVGVATTAVNGQQNVVVNVPYTSVPDTAKVMVWSDLVNVKPLGEMLEYTETSPEWK